MLLAFCIFSQPIVGEIPPYQSAITELDLLSTKYSPMEKLDVIKRSFEKIHEVHLVIYYSLLLPVVDCYRLLSPTCSSI